MDQQRLESALEKLRQAYASLDFNSVDLGKNGQVNLVYQWPGAPDEDVMVCVHQSRGMQEPFHRHDYFYFNYTYQGCYESLSHKYDRKILIKENELYAGQPLAGHALCSHNDQSTVIFGVLIKKDAFVRSFLPLISASSQLFRFFLDPVTSHYAEEYLHFKVEDHCEARTLLEMMIVEYANKRPDTNQVLKTLALAFLAQIARQHSAHQERSGGERLSEQILQYMGQHMDAVSLKSIAAKFSYHPNYVSAVFRKEQGKTFSEALLELRMTRAKVLLKGGHMPVEEVAAVLGYANSSNFYKAFRAYYGCTPRQLLER